jgi:hypothetical protein
VSSRVLFIVFWDDCGVDTEGFNNCATVLVVWSMCGYSGAIPMWLYLSIYFNHDK